MPGKAYGRQTYGAYAVMRRAARGQLDGRRRDAQTIRDVSLRLADGIGLSWDELTEQQRLIVGRAAFKAVALALMEAHALSRGVVARNGTLVPPLHEHYLAFSNSLRLDLVALGVSAKARVGLDIAAILARLTSEDGQADTPMLARPAKVAPAPSEPQEALS